MDFNEEMNYMFNYHKIVVFHILEGNKFNFISQEIISPFRPNIDFFVTWTLDIMKLLCSFSMII